VHLVKPLLSLLGDLLKLVHTDRTRTASVRGRQLRTVDRWENPSTFREGFLS
jgi:hypothetical protein